MSPLLQFALTFVTLVVLATIVYLRLLRYEHYLREEKDGVQRLNERLQALAEGIEALGTRAIEDRLAQIHETLEAIRDALARAARQSPGSAGGVPEAARMARSLRERVEKRLYDLGYQAVRLAGEAEQDASGRTVVRVEADKEGVIHKGHLVFEGESLVECRMQPVYTSFP